MTVDSDVLAAEHEKSLKLYWLASIFILYYDWLITLDTEVQTMWTRRRVSVAHVLFFVNRYFPLVAYSIVLGFILDPRVSQEFLSCRKFLTFPPVAMYISDAVMGAIVIKRTQALYAGSRWTPVMMGIAYAAALVFGGIVTAAATRSPKWLGRYGCVTSYPREDFILLGFLWPAQVIFDLLVFLLTLFSTLRIRRDAGGQIIPLVELIHRDGVSYFAVMFAAKVVNLIIFLTTDPDLTNINWVFNQTICIVMVSRIVLNIREEITQGPRFPLPPAPLEKGQSLLADEFSRTGGVSTLRGGLRTPRDDYV
ncbi:hypothetical protein EXIGLDRAFT_759118 [Exidia glandulosa HHB12029]|uniref:DUF6533 domain-containing protein n=1 Tax=Exidia glandulosa HHB12029 TaxID=1314781 RepID=A0A165Q8L6_EXIGL|nr:hypothetical protein EXIGLDRAFT_759118 [Exidia glandulosa HHB12029]